LIGGTELVELSLLMPCHNEADGVKNNIEKTVSTVKKFAKSFELVLIDDGSTDGTLMEIETCADRYDNIKIVGLEENRGKGHALRKGFEVAEGRYICFLDGDLDIHPRFISTFMEYMRDENTDVVIGSKRHPESVVNYPLKRKIFSYFYQRFVKMLFGLSVMDSQVGLKVFKKEVLDEVFHRVLEKRFAFDIELLINAHIHGYNIVEAPVEMDFMTIVGSDVNLVAIAGMLRDTCAIFYRLYFLHYYDDANKVHNKNQSA